ncbi:MAG: thioredoxin family protein [Deltaproteobacteria bacterium]|nr:thioredoxin family protein [Deltaproteobacteria bacterium]
MPYSDCFVTEEPTREEIDALTSPTVVEFGTDWCGFCQEAQPLIAEAFANCPQISHIKVLDGRGRPLGRSFGVKFWPTLVFLKCGREVARLVRPESRAEIDAALKRIG